MKKVLGRLFKFYKKQNVIVLHSLVLVVVTLIGQSNHYPIGDESAIVSTLDFYDHFLVDSKKVDPNDYVFVNVSKAKDLVTEYDNDSLSIIGHSSITDRKALSDFLNLLVGTNYRYLIIDISFDYKTPYDSLLQSAVSSLNNLVIPYHLEESGKTQSVILANESLADLQKIGGLQYKYSIVQKGHKTIPLTMYEDLYGKEYKDFWLGGLLDGKWVLRDFILEYKIRNYHIMDEAKKVEVSINSADEVYETGVWNKYELGFINLVPSNVVKNIVQDKIVIVGNFEEDKHETLGNEISGSLILLNAFLALEHGDNVISFLLLLFLFFSYILLSLIMFRSDDWIDRVRNRLGPYWKFIISKSILIVTFLVIISAACYFLFGLFVSIFFVSIWAIVVDRYNAFRQIRRSTLK